MTPARVIVTGSRNWPDRYRVYRALNEAVSDLGGWLTSDPYGNTLPDPRRFTLVHGGCPTGADRHADDWAVSAFLEPVVFRADWASHGPSAGPLRNKAMCAAGGALLLAFVGPCTRRGCREPQPHGSHGAAGCVREALRVGIPVRGVLPGVPTGQIRDPYLQ